MTRESHSRFTRLADKIKTSLRSHAKPVPTPKLQITPGTPFVETVDVDEHFGKPLENALEVDEPAKPSPNHLVISRESTRSISLHSAVSQTSTLEDWLPQDRPLSQIVDAARVRGGANGLQFQDSDFVAISTFLAKAEGPEESQLPRIYTLLHSIDALSSFQNFYKAHKTDAELPFEAEDLVSLIHQEDARNNFLRCQEAFVSPANSIEGSNGKHTELDGPSEWHYRRVNFLGRGRFASVEEVQSRHSLQHYALKKLRRGGGVDQEETRVKEVALLRRLTHRHLVRFMGSFTDPKFFCILMSPVAEMHLGTYLDQLAHLGEGVRGELLLSNKEFQQRKKVTQTFYGCLASALYYLAVNRTRHKDIKPENILVSGDTILLTDFGMSHDWNDESQSCTTKGEAVDYTPMYAAKEVVNYERRNAASDIWSLGFVFLEIHTVLSGLSVSDIRQFFRRHGNLDVLYWSNPEAKERWIQKLRSLPQTTAEKTPLDWIACMTDEDPKERPTADQLIRQIIRRPQPCPFIGRCCTPSGELDPFEFLVLEDTAGNIHKEEYPLQLDSDNGSEITTFSFGALSVESRDEASDTFALFPPPLDTRGSLSRSSSQERSTRPCSPITQVEAMSRTSSVNSALSASTGTTVRIISPQITINGRQPEETLTRQLSHSPRISVDLPDISQSVSQALDLIPWDQFPSEDDLPLADKDIDGKLVTESFCSHELIESLQTKITMHLNKLDPLHVPNCLLQNGVFIATRICLILHLMNATHLLEFFHEHRKQDSDLRFTVDELREMLPSSHYAEWFYEYQFRVLVRDLDSDDSTPTKYEEYEMLPFRKIKDLGSGGWAKVDEVENVVTMVKLARKTFPCGSLNQVEESRFRKSFKREVDSLRKLSGHQHIIRYMSSYETPHALALLLSPVAQCNLHEFLASPKAYRDLGKPEDILWKSFGCSSSALEFIHKYGIRHKDVKSENMLLFKTQAGTKLLFTDFGIAYDFSQATKSITRGPKQEGTDRYCAPEAAKHGAARGRRTDIFSLGCVFLEVITVLARKKLHDFHNHLGDDYIYREKLPQIMTWLDQICADNAGNLRLIKACNWCRPLLAKKMDARIYAHDLVARMGKDTSDADILLRSVFWCDACRTELQERAIIKVDKRLQDDDNEMDAQGDCQKQGTVLEDFVTYKNVDASREVPDRKLSGHGIDVVVHRHMVQDLAKCFDALIFLVTDFQIPIRYRYLRTRLKFEMMRLLNSAFVFGLFPGSLAIDNDLKRNKDAVLNLLIQQKTLLKGFAQEPALFSNDSISVRSSRSEELEDSGSLAITASQLRSFPPRLPKTSKDCLVRYLNHESFLGSAFPTSSEDDFAKDHFEHLAAAVTEKNDDLRRLLSTSGTMRLRERDEQANIELLELFDTVEGLQDLVKAVLPRLVPNEGISLIQNGWPIPDKIRSSNPTTPGLWSRQALAFFARFKALNISDAVRDLSKLEIIKPQFRSIDTTSQSNGSSTANYGTSESKRVIDLYRKEDGSVIPVWIEWKYCPREPGRNRKLALDRLRELAALLSDRDKPAEFRVPTCVGYFIDLGEEPESNSAGLIFENPPGNYSVEPISLFQTFTEISQPTWQERTQLAYSVASCLMYLHTACWFHKGLNSSAVLFFRDMFDIQLNKPFLSGFDYSRPAGKLYLSEGLPLDPSTDIYRHPSAQTEGIEKYRRIFDIYSLGVLLVEIANWRPIHQVLGFESLAKISPGDLKGVRRRLLEGKWIPDDETISTMDREKYLALTLACIKGSAGFGLEDSDDDTKADTAAQLQARFYSVVIMGLKSMCMQPRTTSSSN